jgi:hypothetical protein
MEIIDGNRSLSFYDEDNDHEKTYVTVHADSFNEKDFDNFLNCLDKIHESENKRKSKSKVIKNYCVQVPYIDNSIVKNDFEDDDDGDGGLADGFERTCDEMKSNISQMFSYFDEDVHLNYDDYDKLESNVIRSTPIKVAVDNNKKQSESFREKFLRTRRKIKEMGEAAKDVDTRPIIRGVIKKSSPSPPAKIAPNKSLNKNQVDKIMNEFNRVKINYYSKDNYVEFTNIDYFYCDSDIESVRSEKIGKLNQNVLSKFEKAPEIDDIGRKSLTTDIEIVPKNSVRDKIDMFSKLDMIFRPHEGKLMKTSSAPVMRSKPMKENEKVQRSAPTSGRIKSIIKNTSAANKNQNKCFIKDINNSLHEHQVEKDDKSTVRKQQDGRKLNDLVNKIVSVTRLNDVNLLMKLERIVNSFNMSLLHTIDGLMSDDAFTLVGNRMSHLNVSTLPSIERFNETFDGEKIESIMENVELSVVEANRIQLQMQVNVVNRVTMVTKDVKINVIFMAQYETDGCLEPSSIVVVDNVFFIYFTSFFEVNFFGAQKLPVAFCLFNRFQFNFIL